MALTTEFPTLSELSNVAAELLPELARGSAARERDRVLPFDEISRISRAGLVAIRVPREYGGPGGSVRDMFRFVVDLAAVDSNIAQALRPGYLNLESLLAAEESERELWFPRLLRGEFVGNAGWERGGANGEVRTRIVPQGDHYVVNGVKSYSTGALFADWVSISALDPDDKLVYFTVPREREGMTLVDDWDGAGQRLTASGTTTLEDLIVHADELRVHTREEGSRSSVIAIAQLFLGAVLAGIARNALNDAVAYANEHARPIVHSLAKRSVDDPYVQHAVGEISARAYAADAAVIRAAEAIDRSIAAAADGRPGERKSPDQELLTRAAIEVAQAQFIAAESALRSGELLFEVGGASTTMREFNLDRHWRNARTVANHNPRAYKASVVGAYQLTGEEPPTSGLF